MFLFNTNDPKEIFEKWILYVSIPKTRLRQYIATVIVIYILNDLKIVYRHCKISI